MARKNNPKTIKEQPKKKKKPVGVAPMYRAPGLLQTKIDEYFDSLIDSAIYPTISGLALFIGFSSTGWMHDYSKKSKGFKAVVSGAKLRIENAINQMLLNPTTKNVQGPKFYLSAAYKYSEKVDTKLTGSTTQIIRYPQKKAVGSAVLIVDNKSKKKNVKGKKLISA